jgi:polysaccharide biosynthesis protein PslG
MHNLSSAELARSLDEYRAVGADWIRIDLNWSLIQRGGPTSYDWEPFDRIVSAARSRGLRVLAVVQYTPAWARPGTPDSSYPPADLSTYAAFCRAAAEHYAPMGVHHWEIWNEPNIFFWKPQPDPARYAAMLKLAYPAIKDADPSAFVVSAGLSPYGAYGNTASGFMNPLTFLERMYAAGAADNFDALGWHPYEYTGFSFHPSSAWSQLSETSLSARSLMIANGDGDKQIWGTEYGAPTGTGSGAISEAAQAALVHDGYAKWKSWSWSGPLFWHSYRDEGSNLSSIDQNLGLVRHDFSPKPSYAAYRASATG